MNAQQQSERPTNEELVRALLDNGGEMSAVDLLNTFQNRSFQPRDVQRAIQRALNAGVIHVGSRLRLYVTQSQVAA